MMRNQKKLLENGSKINRKSSTQGNTSPQSKVDYSHHKARRVIWGLTLVLVLDPSSKLCIITIFEYKNEALVTLYVLLFQHHSSRET